MKTKRKGELTSGEALVQLTHARNALGYLTAAREALKQSGNAQTLSRVRAAISSAKGAIRICDMRVSRAWSDEARVNNFDVGAVLHTKERR